MNHLAMPTPLAALMPTAETPTEPLSIFDEMNVVSTNPTNPKTRRRTPMSTTTDVAIIGAGPYGLSLAAHLAAANVNVRVFGQPMHFWRSNMPEGMVLKSEGFASNLWDPDGALTLKHFCADRGLPYKDSGLPIPVETFCAYGEAFQKRFVPMLDQRPVVKLDRDIDNYLLRLRDGTTLTANRVVIATGIG